MDRVQLIVRDYGMGISKTGSEVIGFHIRIVGKDGLRSFALSKQTKNEFDGDAHAANDGFTTKNLGVHCYASKKCLVDHGCWYFVVRLNERFVRYDIVDSNRLVGHAIEAQLSFIVTNNLFLRRTPLEQIYMKPFL